MVGAALTPAAGQPRKADGRLGDWKVEDHCDRGKPVSKCLVH